MRAPEMLQSTGPEDEMRDLLRAESDVGLLELIRKKDDWSDMAFGEFVSRHTEYMYDACSRAISPLNGEAWIDDMVHDTFAYVYEHEKPFKVLAAAVNNLELQRRLVRGWMGRVANFKLRGYLKGHDLEISVGSEEWERLDAETFKPAEIEAAPNATTDKEQEKRKRLIEKGLESLSEKEQLVIRKTFQFHRIGRDFQRMPNREVQELAEQLNTTPENLRKIRSRALKKIEKYISENWS